MNKPNRMVITMDCWDQYKDARTLFFQSLEKNWKEREYPIVLGCNSDISSEGLNAKLIVCDDNSTDSKRHLEVLKTVTAEYVLLIVEDGVITKTVDSERLEEILDFMDYNNINFCKLYPAPNKNGKKIKSLKNLKYINKKQPYGINYLCGIYRRSYLLSLLDSPCKDSWEIERMLLKNAANESKGFYNDKVVAVDNPLNIKFCIEKGKWSFWAKSFIKKNDFKVESKRETWSVWHEMFARIKHFSSAIIPSRARHFLKKILGKLGIRFATDY